MPAFRFEAATAAGRIEQGVLDADSARHARALLRERGLAPLEVTALAAEGNKPRQQAFGARLSTAELAIVTRQMASLLAAGLPLEREFFAPNGRPFKIGGGGTPVREVLAWPVPGRWLDCPCGAP